MKLNELLNKFHGEDFLLSIVGLCDEMPFSDYEIEKKQPYWKIYRDRNVTGICLTETNDTPELIVHIAEF
jgi:hypothetical protein